ncbi:MAG TPA: Gx transporter family protein [Chitinivibrionales bacterium]|jgi:heptaprenyl diphosphate synthase|nr:Gx transporter family protein [Chitinivibrionales bacterium]
MQLQSNTAQSQLVKKTAWLLCAVAINALEFIVPRLPFFPWLKPGLANVITILWIVEFGGVDALAYSLLRIWIVGFYFGFSFLTMSLALSGGVLATCAMALAWRLTGKNRLLGTVGLGIIGALFHNVGQLCAVYYLMSANIHLFYQVPVMLAASILFGGIVGGLAPLADRMFRAAPELVTPERLQLGRFSATPHDRFFSALLLAACTAIVFTNSIAALAGAAAGATLIAQVILKGSWSALAKPLSRFWVLFAFVACVNVFFSYGARIEGLPFLTREGIDLTIGQWLRLWTWLQVSAILFYFRFDAVMFDALSTLFRKHHETLFAGVLALEYFPGIAEDSKMYVRKKLSLFFFQRKNRADRQGKTGLQGIDRWAEGLYSLVVRRMEEKKEGTAEKMLEGEVSP